MFRWLWDLLLPEQREFCNQQLLINKSFKTFSEYKTHLKLIHLLNTLSEHLLFLSKASYLKYLNH